MDRLDAVDVKGNTLHAEIQAYWKRFIGKSVSTELDDS